MDSSARADSRPAVILLSGGLDSATVLAIAVREGFAVMALSFDYGQRHRIELDAARRIAANMNIADHVVLPFDLRPFGGSALTAADLDVPKHESADEIGPGVPITYVPARNTVFLSLALALADARGILDIFIGVNALDYSGYPDCRPEFIRAFEQVAKLGTRAGDSGGRFHIHAPLIAMTKAQIIQRGVELGVDYGLTISCYDPDGAGRACGRCDSCLLRRRGFEQAGVPDPTRYR